MYSLSSMQTLQKIRFRKMVIMYEKARIVSAENSFATPAQNLKSDFYQIDEHFIFNLETSGVL